MTKANPSGDGQSAPLGSTLPEPLRVLVTDGGGPVAGRTVVWQILAPGASVTPATTQTGADGIAGTTVTLPPYGSANVVSASSSGTNGSPQTFVATSTGAGTSVTVSVINDAFLPSTFDLKAGGTVTFTWAASAVSHNVNPVAPAEIPASVGLPGSHNAPFSFDAVFPVNGTFRFFCTVHGSANSGMRGTITVVP
jgi:plastocyanin